MDDLEDLFENAPCGYISADKDVRIQRANTTLARWLEKEPGALVGRPFSELLTIGGRMFYETHFAPMLRMQGAFSEVALDLSSASGRKIPVLVNAVERRDETGKPRFIRITIFNASERRQYERGLLDAKATAEQAVVAGQAEAKLREQFIAILGHDLRNPLAAISSGIQLLAQESLSPRGKQVLSLMGNSTARASSLINDMLDFARGRLGEGIGLKIEDARPLGPIVEQVVEELRSVAPDRVIDVRIELSRPVAADHGRIGQLVSNLLGNALTHGSPEEAIRVAAVTTGDTLDISVANGGDPIPEAAKSHLFQPFFRGDVRPSQQGLGLGLYIASEIAKAHLGVLSVASTQEETRFTFTMPLARSPDVDP
jgi:sigma-B regulation protein RsbU (phosphoserine phosphatase)